MQEVKVKDVCNGDLYCLTFRKPRAESARRWEPAFTRQHVWRSAPALQENIGVM